jgi:hypothetical protein
VGRNRLVVVVMLIVGVMALMAPALAENGYQEQPPTERPKVVYKPPRLPEAPRAAEVAGEGEVLPITGADLMPYMAGGVLAVAAGCALVRRARVRGARLERAS